jgi:exosortase A-associated hydrolase 2
VLDAFFLPVEPGQRCCILNTPAPGTQPRRAVVYLHPFGEEMNKARRMAALQARRLAAQGCAVLQIDHYGCGDSTGDFSQARWEAWRHDGRVAMSWLRERYPVPVTLWGLRLGAVLAADLAQDPSLGVDHLLLWQPVTSGSQFLSQFLRLRLASEMLAGGAATTAVKELTEALRRGEPLEIAGYELHPDLATTIDGLKLEALRPAVKRVDWLEVVADSTLPLRPASKRVVEAWRTNGLAIRAGQAVGEPFWSTIEIAECEALLELTAVALRSEA